MTYFSTTPVVSNELALSVLPKLSNCKFGLHFHELVWFTFNIMLEYPGFIANDDFLHQFKFFFLRLKKIEVIC